MRYPSIIEGKCVCGYEFFYEWKNNTAVSIIGDKPFLSLEMSNDIKITYQGKPDYYTDGKETVTLIMCPKCGTIQGRRD